MIVSGMRRWVELARTRGPDLGYNQVIRTVTEPGTRCGASVVEAWMTFPQLETENFRMARPRVQAEPGERSRPGRRRVRFPAESKLKRREGTTLRTPFTIEDSEGHRLAEIALHTREDGTQVTRLRLFSLEGHPTVTVLGDAQGGVVGVHGPGSDRAALLIHADDQGGLFQIRDGAGKTVMELPADLPAPPSGTLARPWWKFWQR